MMRYIKSEPSSNEENSAVVVLPRPPTLSSIFSSFSFSSGISSTSRLFRGMSSSRTGSRVINNNNNNNNNDTIYSSDTSYRSILCNPAIPSPSICNSSNQNDRNHLPFPVASVQVTPTEYDFDELLVTNDLSSLSNHYPHLDTDIPWGVTSSSSAIIMSNDDDQEDYRMKLRQHQIRRRQRSNELYSNNNNSYYDNSNAVTTATAIILPAKIPKSRRHRGGNNINNHKKIEQLIKKQKQDVVAKPLLVSNHRKRKNKKVVAATADTMVSSGNATKKVKTTRTGTTTKSSKVQPLPTPSIVRSIPINSNKRQIDHDVDVQTTSSNTKKQRTSQQSSQDDDDDDDECRTVTKDMNSHAEMVPTVDIISKTNLYLNDWQQTFVNLITYPSDHIYVATRKIVPLSETIIWGRQKLLWTSLPRKQRQRRRQQQQQPQQKMKITGSNNDMDQQTKHPKLLQSQLNVSEDSNITDSSVETTDKKRSRIPAKAGGNHLSQQLVVQAALVTATQQQHPEVDHVLVHTPPAVTIASNTAICSSADLFPVSSIWNDSSTGSQYGMSDDELFDDDFNDQQITGMIAPDPTATKKNNKKNNKTLLIRRTNEQALWFHGGTAMNQKFGQWLQEERQAYRYVKDHHASTAAIQNNNNNGHCVVGASNCRELSSDEMEERYGKIQQSFQFHLLQLIGMDFQSVTDDETMFYGKYNKD